MTSESIRPVILLAGGIHCDDLKSVASESRSNRLQLFGSETSRPELFAEADQCFGF